VCFAYREKDVLSEVSFEIEPGMKVAVVGRSGAGKTTLLNHLPRFHDPRTGRVEVDGRDLRDLSLRSLRGAIGIVSQDTFLFSGTIRDNLLCVRPEASEEDLLRVLAAAQLNDLLERLREGLDTEVGERGVHLSGGERQRLSIARALLKDPPILILDEATSSLDSISENRIRAALDHLMRSGRTCFVIAHRFTTILDADRILVLDEGRLVGQGSHRELYRSNPHYTRLYDEQFEGAVAAGPAGEGRRMEEFLVRDGSKQSRIVVQAEGGRKRVEVIPIRG
jgi:ABC-type multidrug transport system fused ATPase/permease subunit